MLTNSSSLFCIRNNQRGYSWYWYVAALAVFVLFSQLYMPYRGMHLGVSRYNPKENWSKDKILLSEKLDLREPLKSPAEPYWGMVLDNGMRCSYPAVLAPRPKRVLVAGCSVTWGLGVNDSDTFVWKLNELNRDTFFDNAGVTGYGPCRCMEAMRTYMKEREYDLVIYCAIQNHLFRDARWYAERIEVQCPLEGKDVERDLVFVRAYCDTLPEHKDKCLPAVEYHSLTKVYWWGDDTLYLINFAKVLTMHGLGILSEIRYKRIEHNSDSKVYERIKMRFRLILNDMNRLAVGNKAKFAFVSLDGLANELEEADFFKGEGEGGLKPDFILRQNIPRIFTAPKACTLRLPVLTAAIILSPRFIAGMLRE